MDSNNRRKCPYCQSSFTTKYYGRHRKICQGANNVGFLTDSSDEEDFIRNIQSIQQPHTVNDIQAETISGLADCNVTFSDGESSEDEEYIGEDEYNELINLVIEQNNKSNEGNDSLHIIVKLFCLCLALWQYVFGITDTALESLLKLLNAFFHMSNDFFNGAFGLLLTMVPSSLYMFFKILHNETEDKFTRYVVCIKCYNIYNIEDCHTLIRGEKVPRNCSHVPFPNHPQRARRGPCNQPLLEKLKTQSGKEILQPLKIYCYRSIEYSLSKLLARKDFEKACEEWRNRENYDDVMSDVYDGRIWKKFSQPENGFFVNKGSYGLMINVDWFCPYKHVRSYSVGAIYAVLMNLPRKERFKRKNVILIGLIPSMKKEPPLNTFLQPLVSELKVAWEQGFQIKSYESPRTAKMFKLALLLVGCDIPACRKLCGFLGR